MNGFNGAPSPAKGRFSSVARRIEPISYDIGGVKDALTNTIATRSWVDNGGTGTITAYDRMLIISQTREGHLQIEQFLADLRARRRAAPALSVELHWLWLNAKQRDRLMTGQTKPFGGQISMAVDPKHLQQVASDVPHIHGQVVCMNGIGTVIAAGDRRSIITGAIPVIGDCVGYQPVISVPNVGVTAQVRPTFIPGTKTAMLDIASIITRWEPSRKPAIIGAAWPSDKKVLAWNPPPVSPPAQNTTKDSPAATPPPIAPSVKTHSTRGGSASCPIDQPVMPTEQIGTTLRVPLGKPVIVGSITFAPEAPASARPRRTRSRFTSSPRRASCARRQSNFGVRGLAPAFQYSRRRDRRLSSRFGKREQAPALQNYRVTKCSTPCVLAITVRPLSVTRNPRLRSMA